MTVTGRPTEQRPALIDIERLFADPPFSSPSISPDGARIAYLAPHRGRRNVWVRGIDQAGVDAVPVTHDARRGISSYYWSDDPRWLLYVQDVDGNEDWHLYRVDLDAPDEPAVDLTPLGPGSRVFAVDAETTVPGTAIVWMNPRPLYVDVFRIDLSSGRTAALVERTDPAEFFLLDRAGRATWFVSKDGDGTHEVFAVDREPSSPPWTGTAWTRSALPPTPCRRPCSPAGVPGRSSPLASPATARRSCRSTRTSPRSRPHWNGSPTACWAG